MKKVLVAACIVLVAASVSAIDIGGYVENVTGLADSPPNVDTAVVLIEKASTAAWMRQTLGNWVLDGQVSYTFTPLIPLLIDVDRLSLTGVFAAPDTGASSVGLAIGRLRFSDPTSLVLNHTLDGLQFRTSWPTSTFSIGAGTTALTQMPSNGIILSTLDVWDQANYAARTASSRLFASPRVIGTVEYRLRDAFAGQELSLGAVIQEDLRARSELTEVGQVDEVPPEVVDSESGEAVAAAGGRFDTQHVVVSIAGALAPGLYQKTFYALGAGRTLAYLADVNSVTGSSYQYALVLGHMAGIELTYFMPSLLNSRIRLSGLFSTGDADAEGSYYDGNTAGTFTAFVPLSASSFSDVFTLQPGNSSNVGVSYSMHPIAGPVDVLQLELSAVTYLRTAGTGPVSGTRVDDSSDGTYVGTDIDLSVIAQPFSDLRLVLTGGVFVPNAAVMSTGNEGLSYQATLQGVLRF